MSSWYFITELHSNQNIHLIMHQNLLLVMYHICLMLFQWMLGVKSVSTCFNRVPNELVSLLFKRHPYPNFFLIKKSRLQASIGTTSFNRYHVSSRFNRYVQLNFKLQLLQLAPQKFVAKFHPVSIGTTWSSFSCYISHSKYSVYPWAPVKMTSIQIRAASPDGAMR